MVRATGRGENKFCMACFNQNIPSPVNPELDKLVFERRRARADRSSLPRIPPRGFSAGRLETQRSGSYLPNFNS